jgi:hypothetical protein
MKNAVDFSFSALPQIAHYTTWIQEYGTVRNIGDSKFAVDHHGRIVQSLYGDGSCVVRHPTYVFVTSKDGAHWVCDQHGHWSVFD